MDAVSAFGDVEDPGNVHGKNPPSGAGAPLDGPGEVDFSARAISVPSSAQRLNYEKIFQDAAKRIGEFLKRQADEGLQKTYDTLLDMVDRFKGYPKDGTSTPALPKEA